MGAAESARALLDFNYPVGPAGICIAHLTLETELSRSGCEASVTCPRPDCASLEIRLVSISWLVGATANML